MNLVKIMVVEDERITARDIKNSLENLGYMVPAVVSRGEEAIEKAGEVQPDLVLMDIVLKGKIDGIEAADEIRDRWNIPIIFLTAYSDDDTLQRAGITEPFGYLLKPFDDRELHSTIQIALRRHQAEAKMRQDLYISQQLRQEAEKLVELQSRYVSMTSHEFRNPITTIQMSVELLKNYSHKWSDEKKLKHLYRIQSAIEHMTHLLEDVLTIGKVESGQLEFHPTHLDLVQFCQELIEEQQLCNRLASEITLVTQGTFNNPCLDEKLLRHILTNLLSNAIKYSPDDGKIQFTLTGEEEKVIFQIQDRGIGIPLCDLDHLFESFQRATNVGDIPGTGLGLAIVKKCVDRHGGQITVDSTEGVGTLFTVILPIQ